MAPQAATGAETAQAHKQPHPDITLMDLILPGSGLVDRDSDGNLRAETLAPRELDLLFQAANEKRNRNIAKRLFATDVFPPQLGDFSITPKVVRGGRSTVVAKKTSIS